MRVLTDNLAASATLLGSGGSALAAATGYTVASLTDGRLDRPWKSPTAGSTHQIVLDLGSAQSASAAAVFDLYAPVFLNGRVSIYTGTSATGPWTKRADLTGAGRRDWGGTFAPVSSRYWMVELFSLTSGTQPELGEIVLGVPTDLPCATALSPRLVEQVETNGSQATKTGEEIASFGIAWPVLTEAEHAALILFRRAVGGALKSFVLWPRPAKAGGVYLVRLAAGIGWNEDLDLYDGVALEATELARVLRG